MDSLRLVFVSRQFWPLVGGAQTVMAELARACSEQNAEVTLLTARWRATWPERVEHGGAQVYRLPTSGLRFWGTWRYMRALRRWLIEHRDAYDAVYVSMLKHDAYAALGAAGRTGKPTVLRPEGTGITGDVAWQTQARGGRIIAKRCHAAPAIVTIAPTVAEELISAGYDRARLYAIPNGVEIPEPRGRNEQATARWTLAQTHSRFRLPAGAPLVVYTGRLHPHKGVGTLITAWRTVLARHPLARLWIVGDGSEASALQAQISRGQLDSSVVLAGQFDAVGDFYQAADVAVLPSHEELMSLSLLEAMAAGLPVVASDIPGNRYVLGDSDAGRLVPAGQPAPLAEALDALLADPPQRVRSGRAARARVATQFSLAKMATAHLELFARLVAEQAPGE